MPRPRFLRILAASLFFFFSFCLALSLEPTGKRPLSQADFDAWRRIYTPQLSDDGKWLAYAFLPQEGDGDLVLREVASGRELRTKAGVLIYPLVSLAEEPNPEEPPQPKSIRFAFTHDASFIVSTTNPTTAEKTKARQEKKSIQEISKGGLLIMNLTSGETTRIADVKSMQVPSKGDSCLCYLKEPRPEPTKTDKGSSEESQNSDDTLDAETPRSTARQPASSDPLKKKEYGSDLVLRQLRTGTEKVFANVLEYSISRDGKVLLFTVSSKKESRNGVYFFTPGTSSEPLALLTGKGRYLKLAWDREQTQVAFLSDHENASARVPLFKAYLWTRGASEARGILASDTPEIPYDMSLSENAAPAFSRDGKKLYLSVAPRVRPAAPRPAVPGDDAQVLADIWSWKDDYVQPMQKVRALQERRRAYRGVLNLATGSYLQLADESMQSVGFSDDGTRALGADDRSYRRRMDFDGRYTDIYLIDVFAGARRPILKEFSLRSHSVFGEALQWSPDGKWVSYFKDKHWFLLNTADGSSRNLTASLSPAFYNEENDLPAAPDSYGTAVWLKDSSSFLVADRFDVWQLFSDGRSPVCVTAGNGRATKTQLRVQRIEPVDEDDDERGIDPLRPLVLRGESEETRASGFFSARLGSAEEPRRLLWGDCNYRYVGRAKEADALLLTASTFEQYPDLWLTDSSFGAPKKLSNGSAQKDPFTWGKAELFSYRSADGQPLKGILCKPDNFDPKKKYPLLVYVYERRSQLLHTFTIPAPGHNINPSFFVSNGYVVFAPDIVYRTGHPGPSALACVVPAVESLIREGYIDEKAIGIQGHSWGGYEVAYLITQTSLFKAAEAGAPVGNMTSAYSGIRWGSGLPRQFQYEMGQSRMGVGLQSQAALYLENSPIFHADKVHTPLLILSNDNDEAVPYYQGIELFLTLRRLGKEAWLFNYNGEYHHLRRRADQKDFSLRMYQFFEHYLRGVPAPAWMDKGVPYLERDEEKVRFRHSATEKPVQK